MAYVPLTLSAGKAAHFANFPQHLRSRINSADAPPCKRPARSRCGISLILNGKSRVPLNAPGQILVKIKSASIINRSFESQKFANSGQFWTRFGQFQTHGFAINPIGINQGSALRKLNSFLILGHGRSLLLRPPSRAGCTAAHLGGLRRANRRYLPLLS